MRIGARRKLAVTLALVSSFLLITGATEASLWRAGPATAAKAHHARHAKRHARGGRHARSRHKARRRRIGPGTVAPAGSQGSPASGGEGTAGATAGSSKTNGSAAGASGSSGATGSSGMGSGGSSPSSDPFAGQKFYVEPNSAADRTEQEWSAQGRAAEAAEMSKIASQPDAEWFGDWSYGHGGTRGDVEWWVGQAAAAGALPVIVAYDMPWRDCSQFSSGGASSASAYREFINGMAAGIGAHNAVVILEPDALAELGCLSGVQQSTYYSLLSYAVATLGAQPKTAVYLDAGNANWQPAATIAARLKQADLAGARGFSLNVSNFDATSSEVAYGEAVARDAGGSPRFIVDTGRNGRGADGGEWCNPPGRGLGADPTADTGNPVVDAFFWVKRPGQSDGTCNGGPAAGQWWSSYALELARNSAG